MNQCKLSICIPTYNCGNYISETIESILAQNFSNFELLIIDNASDDQTSSIVNLFAKRDPRIKYLINEENLGMVNNWNACLYNATGEYIKFVFADDILASPYALKYMVNLLDSDKSISLVCSARNLINKSSEILKVDSNFETGIMAGTDIINCCLQNHGNLIGEPSVVMFRRSQALRGFKTNYKQIVDLEMWFHLLEQGALAYINEPLCSFRIHEHQQTAKNKETSVHLEDYIYLYDDYLQKDYIQLSALEKTYKKYDNLYKIWKLHKNNTLSRENALRLISSNRCISFFIWYPLYKLIKPFYKIINK